MLDTKKKDTNTETSQEFKQTIYNVGLLKLSTDGATRPKSFTVVSFSSVGPQHDNFLNTGS